jgi:hypothetical protein
MNLYQVTMSHILSRVVKMISQHSTLPVGLTCLLLAGCTPDAPLKPVNKVQQEKLPQHQLADFLSTPCDNVWSLTGQAVESNPLYWLRGMDCAERLSPVMARAEARRWPDDTWQSTFKRGILLANAKITPLERRAFTTRMDTLSPQLPMQVRTLFQVWRDGQATQLQLAEERSRYAKLQESRDSDLEALRQQQQHLREELEITSRKLENLTDIERRLSTRKPGGAEIPDSTRPAQPDAQQEEVKP